MKIKIILSTLLLAQPLLASAYDIAVENANSNITFADATVKALCIANWDTNGDDELSEDEAAAVTDLGFVFSDNIDITSFNELKYFTGLTSIGYGAFDMCTGLTSITIPNSVTNIGESAFFECSGLTSVTIPNSVTSIGDQAFYGCSGLTSFAIPNSVTNIGAHAFDGCGSLSSVTISNSLTKIESRTFRGCCGLSSITIPNSVTNIEEWAFECCSGLASVTIPNSVTFIDYGAFKDCTGLTSVISKMENPCDINTDCFPYDVFNKATLYVPQGTIDKYRSTDYWNKFLSIEEGEPDKPKCTTPTISYANKALSFSCGTEGVEYHYTITVNDYKSNVGSEVSLSATYEISVYATKSGYGDSNVATATLVWTDAVFTGATPSISTSAKTVRESIPVLISTNASCITVMSEADGQKVDVFSTDGQALGSATVKKGQATISTNLQKGSIAIVKVGDKVVKVVIQ